MNQARRAACPAAMREPIAAAAGIFSPIQFIGDNTYAPMTDAVGCSGQGRQLDSTAGERRHLMHKRIVDRSRVTRRPLAVTMTAGRRWRVQPFFFSLSLAFALRRFASISGGR